MSDYDDWLEDQNENDYDDRLAFESNEKHAARNEAERRANQIMEWVAFFQPALDGDLDMLDHLTQLHKMRDNIIINICATVQFGADPAVIRRMKGMQGYDD